MKFIKELWSVLIVIAFIGLMVHQGHAYAEKFEKARTPILETIKARFFVDPDTGCHYLVNLEGGITPRLTADGRILCIK